MIEAGMKAPDFTLNDKDGKAVSLSDFLGKKVVLYFYPKDNTPGCTRQACAFAGAYGEFKNKKIEVVGISKDSVASHKKFEEKYGLPFTLLSDTEKEVIQAYDVWKEKNNYGKKTMGVVRSTYLIDEKGKRGIVDVLVINAAVVVIYGGVVKTDKHNAVALILNITCKIGVTNGVCKEIILVGTKNLRTDNFFDTVVISHNFSSLG